MDFSVLSTYIRTYLNLIWNDLYAFLLFRNTRFWLANIYYVTSSGPEEDVGKTGTSFTSGRTSEPVDVRKTAERATLSEP